MGLTDFRPFFKVVVDGEDITSILSPRLVRLQLNDAAGVESDRVQISLSDASLFAKLEEPGQGAEIKVWLGYAFDLKYMGTFIADTVSVTGPPDVMQITGLASPQGETGGGKTALTEQKTRSWDEGTTIGEIAEQIAGEHGMRSAVSASLTEIKLPHVDQLEESDINLLSRILREHDGIAKPGDGRIVVAKRGESLTASGKAMPVIDVIPRDVSRWAYSNSLREKVGEVVASYQDKDAAETKEIKVGGGKPCHRLRQRYPSEGAARSAAKSEFGRFNRAGRSLRLSLPGNPDLVAEGRVNIAGFRGYIDGEWLITGAAHSLDSGGYRTRITCEPPK